MLKSENILKQSIRKCSSRLIIVIFFSFFINILMFVAPLHMLQIYDRVLVSRSEITLIVLTLGSWTSGSLRTLEELERD